MTDSKYQTNKRSAHKFSNIDFIYKTSKNIIQKLSLKFNGTQNRIENLLCSWHFKFLASINAIACILGGILSATLLDRIGRKFTLVVINLFSIISWASMALASKSDQESLFWELMFSRLLIGITTGLSSSPAGNSFFLNKYKSRFFLNNSLLIHLLAVYSAEIAHPKLRGRLTLLTSMAIAVGILMIYVLGYFIPVRNFCNQIY